MAKKIKKNKTGKFFNEIKRLKGKIIFSSIFFFSKRGC